MMRNLKPNNKPLRLRLWKKLVALGASIGLATTLTVTAIKKIVSKPEYKQPVASQIAKSDSTTAWLDYKLRWVPTVKHQTVPSKKLSEYDYQKLIENLQFLSKSGKAHVYDSIITKEAREHNLDPHLIKGIIAVESSFNPKVRSKFGALGLMQVKNIVVDELNRTNKLSQKKSHIRLLNPQHNIEIGVKYFSYLVNLFNGDIDRALFAYHYGPTIVKKVSTEEILNDPYVQKVKIAAVWFSNNARAKTSPLKDAAVD